MSERRILLVLVGLAVLILSAVWMMVSRIRPSSEIDAVITILLAFFAYAVLLFAVMIWRSKIELKPKNRGEEGFIQAYTPV